MSSALMTAPAWVTELLCSMVGIAHDPKRLTDGELSQVLAAWNGLLTNASEMHQSCPDFFTFHQAVLVEYERRFSDSRDAERSAG